MAKKSKVDKELLEAYEELKAYNENSKKSKNKNDLLQFFVGLLMLAAGLYMIFQHIEIRNSMRSGFIYFGNFGMPNGLIFLPILIGIVMLFLMEKKVYGWIVIAVGIVIVLAAVLLNTQMTWRGTNAFNYIIMFGLTAAGGALTLKELLKKD